MRNILFTLTLGALAAACGSGGGQQKTLSAYECLVTHDCPRLMVAAHRGYHLEHPENSLTAIRAAAEIGADFSELDVRHTSDEVLVLMHDSDVDRTTDGSGKVDTLTWSQIQTLLLDDGDPGDPDDSRVPLFSDALALAKSLDIMLYVDQKTDRTDLVLAAIQAGSYQQVALVRDDLGKIAPMFAADDSLLVMPPIESQDELQAALAELPALKIVEIGSPAPEPDLTAAIHAAGLKAQQDVLALGDILSLVGDYTEWGKFVSAGVDLPQTDYPNLLIPAIKEYEETGIFPDKAPQP
ncbi:MAG TPA: glycerophosphodiester phosphodiesterase family protein [Myxococcota bacterium]|nr:glycerophosphodiester phosphodiesterase family protein [Myxococcota bacterium]